jgi:hypothetical protein
MAMILELCKGEDAAVAVTGSGDASTLGVSASLALGVGLSETDAFAISGEA